MASKETPASRRISDLPRLADADCIRNFGLLVLVSGELLTHVQAIVKAEGRAGCGVTAALRCPTTSFINGNISRTLLRGWLQGSADVGAAGGPH